MEKVNLAQKFSLFQDYWSPKIAGELNDSYLKLVKLKGEFVWHHHEAEDELFLVIIPKGVEHLPVAEEEVHVLLLEPKTTVNTGNTRNEKTITNLERI
jgi:mannose-6-phosphate isomerase-like protein (cupin superfamily)